LPVDSIDGELVAATLRPLEYPSGHGWPCAVIGSRRCLIGPPSPNGELAIILPGGVAILEHMLSDEKPKKQHHPALPYDQVPAFFETLRKRNGITARAWSF